MAPQGDPSFAFLGDRDLLELSYRVAFRLVQNEAFANDLRQGAFVVAMELVLEGRGPEPGRVRGWICCVTKNHTHEELRELKEQPKVADTDDDESREIPVEDRQTLHLRQLEIERERRAMKRARGQHPKEAALLLAPDGRSRDGADAGPRDDVGRKRKERAREVLKGAFTAALAVAVLLLWFRGNRPGPKPGLPTGAYATLADASHELARQDCAAHEWVACVDGLEKTRRLDASKIGPAEEAARQAAVQGIRDEALAQCAQDKLLACVEGLDTARRYDPAGEREERVQLARSEAQHRLTGAGATAPSWVPDAKLVPTHP